MPKKVARIEAVYSIDDIGTVIALPDEEEWLIDPSERIHKRERIQIRAPGGRCISTFIEGIKMMNRGRDRDGVCFSLPRSVVAEDIPEGSEFWLERDGSEPLIET